MKFKIVIPTYKRIQIFKKKTYQKIIQKYNLDEVYIFVVKDEVEIYQKQFPDCYIVESPKGYTETFNYFYDYFDENDRLLILHDDVDAFYELKDGKLKEAEDFISIMNSMFKDLELNNMTLGGFYPCQNELWMSKSPKRTDNLKFIIDPVSCHINKKDSPKVTLRYKGHEHSKQDIENSIIHYIKYGGVLRYNHYCYKSVYAPKNDKTGVGFRSQDREVASAEGIVEKWPEYCYIKHNKKGIQVGMRRNIKKKFDCCSVKKT